MAGYGIQKRRNIIFLLSGVLFAVILLVGRPSEATEKRLSVLVINSYSSGYTWTDDQCSGIVDVLKKAMLDIDIHVEYLDWKEAPNQKNLKLCYDLFQHRYAGKKLDLIITTDDKALEFALQNRNKIFSSAPIVFSGVADQNAKKLTAGFSNVTGVLEMLDPYNTVKTAVAINPFLKSIYLIYDNTESGVAEANESVSAIRKVSAKLNTIPLNQKTHREIISLSRTMDKNSVILLASYYMDVSGDTMSYEEFCTRLGKVSKVPVYHLFDFTLGYGITGGSLVNGRLHGSNAAKIAVEVLKGRDINAIPIRNMDSASYRYDYNQLNKYNILMTKLPKESDVINKPFSFMEEYWEFVAIAVTIIWMLILFLTILTHYLNKNRKLKHQLELDNHELNALYEENAAAEETLREQFSELEDAQQKLSYSAYHDSLTGLYNRTCMNEKINRRMKENETHSIIDAMLFIDIDNFKYINDSMGHSYGDKLLIHVSERLLSVANEDLLLFRLGGDEFVLYAMNHNGKSDIQELAEKLLTLLREPFDIEGNILTITASIGIAIFPEDAENIHELLQYSDMAMYMAKKNNKNSCYFFNSIMNAELQHRVNVEKQFKTALTDNEFQLYYQPLVRLEDNRIIGFEALIRWNSKELGRVSPDEFISIAEETGFIVELGEWVLRNSLSFIKNLNAENHASYVINVNISPIQLLQQDFLEMISKMIMEIGIDPCILEIEITEGVIMNSTDAIMDKLSSLRAMGVEIAVDDFGTGYSSLMRLRTLPITTLKIDKAFIDSITDENDSNEITDTIIDLGHKLELKIIAEGVETDAQLSYLCKNNCDIVQGYLFYKPMPESEIDQFLGMKTR